MPDPKTTRLPMQLCPWCGHTLNGASSFFHDEAPEPGNLTVCIACAGRLDFTEGMGLRKLEGAELEEVRRDEPEALRNLATHQRAIVEMWGEIGVPGEKGKPS